MGDTFDLNTRIRGGMTLEQAYHRRQRDGFFPLSLAEHPYKAHLAYGRSALAHSAKLTVACTAALWVHAALVLAADPEWRDAVTRDTYGVSFEEFERITSAETEPRPPSATRTPPIKVKFHGTRADRLGSLARTNGLTATAMALKLVDDEWARTRKLPIPPPPPVEGTATFAEADVIPVIESVGRLPGATVVSVTHPERTP